MENNAATDMSFKAGALVLYKQTPALVGFVGEKIELTFPDGKSKKVRPKDIKILHPGPVASLKKLMEAEINVDLEEAWELLQGETASLADLTELTLGDGAPENVWAVFREVRASDLFSGDVDGITPLSPEEVEAKREKKRERERSEREWIEHVERLRNGVWDERDLPRLKELERYACGLSSSARILKELKIPSTPEKAHELLLRLGVWSEYVNPHPLRAGMELGDPDIPVPPTPEEKRLDLTALASFAVDDDGCRDPDDAVSVEDGSLWVHVADPAAVAAPDSPMDLEARGRGSNAYLPEKMVKMLPDGVTRRFGLGLDAASPAISFKMELDPDGAPRCERVELSVISAEMITYEEAESRRDEEPFATFAEIAAANRRRREAAGAFSLNLPEVKVRAVFDDARLPLEKELGPDGRNDEPLSVEVSRYPELGAREVISELMVMAGEAIGRFLRENDIPAPFAGQAPPESPIEKPDSLSAMFALRRQLRRSQLHSSPARHSGLGLDVYTRATSPLRRYSDLLAHQQIRAFLKNAPVLSESEILERMSQGETGALRANTAERRSVSHWTLVHLKRRGDAVFAAVVVEIMDNNRCRVVIPELAMDAVLRNQGDVELDQELKLKPANVNIPESLVVWRRV
jgi:exoribonuclease-2